MYTGFYVDFLIANRLHKTKVTMATRVGVFSERKKTLDLTFFITSIFILIVTACLRYAFFFIKDICAS